MYLHYIMYIVCSVHIHYWVINLIWIKIPFIFLKFGPKFHHVKIRKITSNSKIRRQPFGRTRKSPNLYLTTHCELRYIDDSLEYICLFQAYNGDGFSPLTQFEVIYSNEFSFSCCLSLLSIWQNWSDLHFFEIIFYSK